MDAAKIAQDLMHRRMVAAQVVDGGLETDSRKQYREMVKGASRLREDKGYLDSFLAGARPDQGSVKHLPREPELGKPAGKDPTVILRAEKGKNWLGTPAGAPSPEQTGVASGKPAWAEVMKRVSDVADEGVVTISFDRTPAGTSGGAPRVAVSCPACKPNTCARGLDTASTASTMSSSKAFTQASEGRFRHLAYTPKFMTSVIDDDGLIAVASEDAFDAPPREWTF